MTQVKPLTCGIVGCGVIGPAHAEGYSLIPQTRLTWACDISKEKAERLAVSFRIPNVTADYRDLLADSDLDCLSVCTDHASHAEICAAALDAGKHVLCEKALAASHAGLDQMMSAAARHPELVFSGVFQHRFDAVHRLVKDTVDSGAFGRMLTANLNFACWRSPEYYKADAWRGTWAEEGGSLLMNQAIHYVDILTWIMGGAAEVTAFHANLTHAGVIETEDAAAVSILFNNGALGSVAATSSSYCEWDSCMNFVGTDGMMRVVNGTLSHASFRDKTLEAKVKADAEGQLSRPCLGTSKAYYGASHPTQIADFVDAILEGRAPFVQAKSARHAVEIALAVYASQKERRTVRLHSTP